jgi:Cupin domain
LTGQANGRHAWKVLIPPEPGEPEMRTHEGYEWLYVLSGKLRLILGDRDITLNAAEASKAKRTEVSRAGSHLPLGTSSPATGSVSRPECTCRSQACGLASTGARSGILVAA